MKGTIWGEPSFGLHCTTVVICTTTVVRWLFYYVCKSADTIPYGIERGVVTVPLEFLLFFTFYISFIFIFLLKFVAGSKFQDNVFTEFAGHHKLMSSKFYIVNATNVWANPMNHYLNFSILFWFVVLPIFVFLSLRQRFFSGFVQLPTRNKSFM